MKYDIEVTNKGGKGRTLVPQNQERAGGKNKMNFKGVKLKELEVECLR